MEETIFECANVPVSVAAKALKVDCQIVRLWLQNGIVRWGFAYRRTPARRHFSYVIYPRRFYEETGFYSGEVQLVSRNRGFTDKLAMEILDREIRKCEKALQNLEIGTEDYDNAFGEWRMYQMHKDTLLIKKGGGRHDGQ